METQGLNLNCKGIICRSSDDTGGRGIIMIPVSIWCISSVVVRLSMRLSNISYPTHPPTHISTFIRMPMVKNMVIGEERMLSHPPQITSLSAHRSNRLGGWGRGVWLGREALLGALRAKEIIKKENCLHIVANILVRRLTWERWSTNYIYLGTYHHGRVELISHHSGILCGAVPVRVLNLIKRR